MDEVVMIGIKVGGVLAAFPTLPLLAWLGLVPIALGPLVLIGAVVAVSS